MALSKPVTRGETEAVIASIKERFRVYHAGVAREQLAVAQASGGPIPYEQFVDGRKDSPLESVRFGGIILFTLNRLGAVLEWIYTQLVQHSPIGKPTPPHLHYFQDHQLSIDGNRINARIGEVIEVPRTGTAVILDARPYATPIERGLSTQAPHGVYEIVAVAAQRRFPYAEILFDYQRVATDKYLHPAITVRIRR